jgi:hypothetical protein
MLTVFALNEWDSKYSGGEFVVRFSNTSYRSRCVCIWTGVDWRRKIVDQAGAVLATELKNNAFKIAKCMYAIAIRFRMFASRLWV